MRLLLILLSISLFTVSCGKNSPLNTSKKSVKKKKAKSKPNSNSNPNSENKNVAVAKNQDRLIVGDLDNMPAQERAELEGQISGDNSLEENGKIATDPEPDSSSSESKVEVGSSVAYNGSVSSGTNQNGLAHGASAKVVVDIIDSDKDEILWTIPVEGSVSTVAKGGKQVGKKIDFNLNVQKILSPYFSVSGEFQGGWNDASIVNRRLFGGVGGTFDVLGNMRRPGQKPQLLTSFYLLGGHEQYNTGNDLGKARGSFRVELRDIYLTNPEKDNGVGVKLFGKTGFTTNLTSVRDNVFTAEAGLSVLSPRFFNDIHVNVTPTYKYQRVDLGPGSTTEHLHTFNLGFSLDGPIFGN